jgi:hypothetical protein
VVLGGAWGGTGLIDPGTGSLELEGTFRPDSARWGVSARPESVRVTGTLDLAGGTFVIDETIGAWTLHGGRVQNGTLDVRAGGAFLVRRNAMLDRIRVKGELRVGDYDGVQIRGGLDLTGSTLLLPGARLEAVESQTITGGTLVLGGVPAWTAVVMPEGVTLTLSPTTLVRGAGGWFQGQGTLRNEGTIRSDVANQQIRIQAATFDNVGLVEAKGGGNVVLGGAWGGTGLIDPGTGSLELEGTFRPDSSRWGVSARTDAVRVTGTLDLAGGTFVIDETIGAWTLHGGRVQNGTLDVRAGGAFLVRRGGTLDRIRVKGELRVGDYDGVQIRGGLDLTGATLLLPGARLEVVDTQTITGGTLVLGGVPAWTAVVMPAGVTLTLSPTTLVRGAGGWFQGQGTLRNEGTICSDVAGQQIRIQAATFDNVGLVEAKDGANVALAGAWGGTGRIDPGTGSLELDGTFRPDSARWGVSARTDAVRVTGTLDLAGGTFVIDDTIGAWTLHGGRVQNGTLDVRAGGAFWVRRNGVLDRMRVKGELRVGDYDGVQIRGGLDLTGATFLLPGARMEVVDTQTITGGTLVLGGVPAWSTVVVPVGVTLTLSPSTLVRGAPGWFQGAGTLVNQGILRADVAGQTLRVQTAVFRNEGKAEALNGGLLDLP